jgi:hypothetical protein
MRHPRQTNACFDRGRFMCTSAATTVALGVLAGIRLTDRTLHGMMMVANTIQGSIEDKLFAGQTHMLHTQEVMESIRKNLFKSCLFEWMVVSNTFASSVCNLRRLWDYASKRGAVAIVMTRLGHSQCLLQRHPRCVYLFDPSCTRIRKVDSDEIFDEFDHPKQTDVLFMCEDPQGLIARFYHQLAA